MKRARSMVTPMGLGLDLYGRIDARDLLRQSIDRSMGAPGRTSYQYLYPSASRGKPEARTLIGDEGRNCDNSFGRETIDK